MTIENFEYHFKVRNVKEVALTLTSIYKDVAYSRFDKRKLQNLTNLQFKQVNDKNYVQQFEDIARKIEQDNFIKLEQLCKQMQEMWRNYRNKYIDIICKMLGFEINNEATNHLYCDLHMLPINEIDLNDCAIYLDANKGAEEIFKKFIVMLTKLAILNRFKYTNKWEFNSDFDAKNKVFMFVDVAADAVFKNSELSKICDKPSYQYFYNLQIDDENVMDKFNNLYKNISLDEFFDEVYIFIHRNYQKFLDFKHFLY